VIIEPVTDGIDLSIAYRTIEDIYGKNVFFINEESIAQSLKNDQKNIKEIKIDRLYPNGIKILLSSYPTTFDVKIVGIDNKAWNMTENGVLVPKNDPSKK
jgi:cell division septal protein FtsQ